jgi:acetoin utilization deacetylase AcuC-like enzyme
MYNAGVDVHGDDSLGKMALTNEGILQRDRFVMAQCAAAKVGAGRARMQSKATHAHLL